MAFEIDFEMQLAEVRNLMEEGRLLEALEKVERFMESADKWIRSLPRGRESEDDRREVDPFLKIARHLAGEIRGRMAQVVIAGSHPGLGSSSPSHCRGLVSDVRFLMAGPGLSGSQKKALRGLALG